MNIRVIKDRQVQSHLTGGEVSVCRLDIHIDPDLPIRDQRILVIHSVIENYNRSMSHNKVEELCRFIEDALDMLESDEKN